MVRKCTSQDVGKLTECQVTAAINPSPIIGLAARAELLSLQPHALPPTSTATATSTSSFPDPDFRCIINGKGDALKLTPLRGQTSHVRPLSPTLPVISSRSPGSCTPTPSQHPHSPTPRHHDTTTPRHHPPTNFAHSSAAAAPPLLLLQRLRHPQLPTRTVSRANPPSLDPTTRDAEL
ncbi:hypothetical protein BST61_g11572 [Cercospora zeina]